MMSNAFSQIQQYQPGFIKSIQVPRKYYPHLQIENALKLSSVDLNFDQFAIYGPDQQDLLVLTADIHECMNDT